MKFHTLILLILFSLPVLGQSMGNDSIFGNYSVMTGPNSLYNLTNDNDDTENNYYGTSRRRASGWDYIMRLLDSDYNTYCKNGGTKSYSEWTSIGRPTSDYAVDLNVNYFIFILLIPYIIFIYKRKIDYD